MANLAALGAAVISLSAKNCTGGWNHPPPAAGARVKRAPIVCTYAIGGEPLERVTTMRDDA